MSWIKMMDKHFHVKVHYCNRPLFPLMAEDLFERYGAEPSLELSEITDEVYFEPGGYGMYSMNQPRMRFDVGGNTLELDSAKVFECLVELKNAEQQRFVDGTEYVTLFSRFSCLVLSIPERESLMFQLQGKLKEANAQADAFFDEAEAGWKAMTESYKQDTGKDFPVLRYQDIVKNKPLN